MDMPDPRWIDSNYGRTTLTLRDSSGSMPGRAKFNSKFYKIPAKNEQQVVIVAIFTPVPGCTNRIGVPEDDSRTEIIKSDASEFGGIGMDNMGAVKSRPVPYHDEDHSINIFLWHWL
jgi:hypothetical protein